MRTGRATGSRTLTYPAYYGVGGVSDLVNLFNYGVVAVTGGTGLSIGICNVEFGVAGFA